MGLFRYIFSTGARSVLLRKLADNLYHIAEFFLILVRLDRFGEHTFLISNGELILSFYLLELLLF